MNIEFKEPFFRFIFPTCLFWTLLIIVDRDVLSFFTLYSIGLALIVFIASGFLFYIFGSLLIQVLNFICHPVWEFPENELSYWKKLGEEKNEFVKKKIDRRWDLFVTNIYALGVTLLVFCFYLTTVFIFREGNWCSLVFKLLFLLSLLLALGVLSYKGFVAVKFFGHYYKQEKL
jgi:hypothetical protein